jgi:hypothetical protein
MGNPRSMYQVRDSSGRIRTVIAFSHRGAVNEYLETYDPSVGEILDVKRRGADPEGEEGWQSFKVREE